MSDSAEAERLSPSGVSDPAAWAALSAASREKADAFLEKQTVLAGLQAEELIRENELHHWSLRVRHTSDVLRLGFELAVALLALGLIAFIGAVIWQAAHDKSLVIEAFNVPPDMAGQGLTGEVAATRFEDHLSWIQDHVDTARAASTFRNNWGDDIKVQIPDTGVSISEVYRFLANWLGNETHITGQVWHENGELAVSARAGGEGHVYRGRNLDALLGQAAEYVYGQTQSYRYTVYLATTGRVSEAFNAAHDLADHGSAEDKPWAYTFLSVFSNVQGDFKKSVELNDIAAALGSDIPIIYFNRANAQIALGHYEQGLTDNARGVELLRNSSSPMLASRAVAGSTRANAMVVDEAHGDYLDAVRLAAEIKDLPGDYSTERESTPVMASADLARAHDVKGSLTLDGKTDEVDAKKVGGFGAWSYPPIPQTMRDIALENWAAVRAQLSAFDLPVVRANPYFDHIRPVWFWPLRAHAEARTGDFKAAEATIAATPLDCYPCVEMRGNVRALEKKWDAASFWFADAVKQAPSYPFAYTDWGAMLMANGDYDGAIEKFREANLKGPHFADPLEMWGEALVAKNRSDLALAKFEEANKYAPNWGRLHIKWGEALFWTGDKAGAKKQYGLANGLDLTPSEKSELAKVSHV